MREVIDLVIAGGASHVVGLAGAASVLDAHVDIARVGGTSAGALVAAAIARGLTPDEIKRLLRPFLAGNRLLDRQFNPFNGWGLHKGERLRAALREVFGRARLCDVWIPLRVVTCDLFTRRPVVIDSTVKEHAEISLVDACYASAAIPLFFRAASIPGLWGLFVDGGTVANAKGDLFDDVPTRRTVMVRLQERPADKVTPIRGVAEYVGAVADLLLHASNNAHVSRKLWADVVQVPTVGSGLDFDLSDAAFDARYSAGQAAARRWCDER